MSEDFAWLLKWYAWHCDKYWEEWYGIILETTENPGWALTISIDETELESLSFEEIKYHVNENDWLHCSIQNKEFIGSSSPANIDKLLFIFRQWAEPYGSYSNLVLHKENKDALKPLLSWYAELCKNGLSCKRRILINTLPNPGWNLVVNLQNTKVENQNLDLIRVERSDDDWYHCFTKGTTFYGPCGNSNFFEVCECFTKHLGQKLFNASSLIARF